MSTTDPSGQAAYKTGQVVYVYDVNGGRGGVPKEQPGTVVKVGRKLVTVEYGHGYTKAFRIEDGRSNDNYGHHWIKTEGQRRTDNRRSEAVATLRDAGITVEPRCRLTVGTLETLALVVTDA